MPRKRQRNAGLSIKKKSKRINTEDQTNRQNNVEINMLNYCNVVTTNLDNNSSNSNKSSDSSISNVTNDINSTINIETATITVSDNENDDENEENVPTVNHDFNLELKVLKQMRKESHRWSVFNLFLFKYKGLNPPDQIDLYQYWSGRDGVGSRIKRDLHLPRTYSVKERMLPIFEQILDCFKTGEKFHPSSVDNRGGNRKLTIRLDSFEAQIIADGMEAGLSVRRVWENVNRHRRENADELVSQSCIYYVLRKMRPKVVNISKRKQGSSDPDSNWAQARCAWTKQLLAKFGTLKKREPTHGPVEKRFDGAIQGKLALDQIVWWDETHRKCLIGGQNPSKSIQIIFPRNEDGKIDIQNGQYSKERKTILNVKYEKECRLGLGVAKVTPLDSDGNTLPAEGRRCHPYDYSSKVMISIDDYKKMMKLEFQRVKSLKARNGYWLSSERDKNIKYYNNDPVIMLRGVGKKASQQLKEIGIKTVGEIENIETSKLDNLPNSFKKKTYSIYERSSTSFK